MAFEVFSMVGRIAVEGVNKVKVSLGDIEKATTKMANTGSTNFQKFNTSFQGINDKIQRNSGSIQKVGATFTAIGAAVGLAGRSMVLAGAEFDTGMRRVGALTQATGEDFDGLREKAKTLGASTSFSANEAASAMGFLAQAGFDTNEIMGSMEATLSLAAAAQIDLGTAADISSNILSGFGLDASELTDKVDALVNTTINSNTNMLQLGEGMKFIAPVAAAAGVSLEDTAAAMGLLGNAGIQGSMAGTTLRTAITRLLTPSKEAAVAMGRLGLNAEDANGNFVGFDGIIKQLEGSVGTFGSKTDFVADLMEVFGQRGGPGMAALLGQGSEALADLRDSVDEVGTAANIADALLAGTEGAMIEFKSALEGLKIAVFDSGIGDFFGTVVRGATGFLRALTELNPEVLKFGSLLVAAIGAISLVLGPLLLALPSLSGGIALVVKFLAGSGGASLLGALGTLTAPLTLTVAAIAALTVGIVIWRKEITEFLLGALSLLGVDVTKLITNINVFVGVLGDIGGVIVDVVLFAVGRLAKDFTELFDKVSKFVSFLRNEGKRELKAYSDATEGASSKTTKFNEALGDFVSVADDAANATARAIAGTSKYNDELGDFVSVAQDAIDKLDGEKGELEKIADALVDAAGGTGDLTAETEKLAKEETLAEKAIKKFREELQKANAKMEEWAENLRESFLDSTRDSIVATEKLGEQVILTAKDIEESLKNRVKPAWEIAVDAAEAATQRIEDAFEAMGITTTTELLEIAATAEEQFNTIKESGEASAQQLEEAWAVVLQRRQDALRAQGADLSAEEQAILDDILSRQEQHVDDSTDVFERWGNQVSTIVSDFGKAVSESVLDFFSRGAFNDGLQDQVTDLRDSLADRVQAFEDFTRDVEDNFESFRETLFEKQAEQIDDLVDKLNDGQQKLADFEEDRLKKISKILTKEKNSAKDATKKRAIELKKRTRDLKQFEVDKREDFRQDRLRKERKLEERIASIRERGREGAQDEIQRLRVSFAASIREDETELETSLDRRKREFQDWVDDTETELKRRTEIERREAEAAVQIQKDAIAERREDFAQFAIENGEDIEAVKLATIAALDAEDLAVKESLANQRVDLEQFKSDTLADIEEINMSFRTLWGDIGSLGKQVFNDIGSSIVRLVTEDLVGNLFKELGNLVDTLLPNIGDAFDRVFGGAGDAIGGGGGIPGLPGVPGGGGGGGGGGASLGSFTSGGIIGLVTGAITAVSSVFSNFQFAAMNKSLDLIETATRRVDIGITQEKGLLDQFNGYAFTDEWSRHNVMFERMAETAGWIVDNASLAFNLGQVKLDDITDDIVASIDNVGLDIAALTPSITINVETLNARDEDDINAIAQELFELNQTAAG